MTLVILDKRFKYFYDFSAFFQTFKSSQMLAKDIKDSQSRLNYFRRAKSDFQSPLQTAEEADIVWQGKNKSTIVIPNVDVANIPGLNHPILCWI